MQAVLRAEPTYEGLKVPPHLLKDPERVRAEPTYEGLKVWVGGVGQAREECAEPTYEGLKEDRSTYHSESPRPCGAYLRGIER